MYAKRVQILNYGPIDYIDIEFPSTIKFLRRIQTMQPKLETMAGALNYGDLPETWRIPEDDRFSATKTLYDYQTDALRKAARAL